MNKKTDAEMEGKAMEKQCEHYEVCGSYLNCRSCKDKEKYAEMTKE